MNYIALHGFLGTEKDWEIFPFLRPYTICPELNFTIWAVKFNEWIEVHTSPPRTLVGYSMGGRLALHALLLQPNLWAKAVLISTHPGLKNPAEKTLRYSADCRWAEQFLRETWSKLMHAWEAQAIFQNAQVRFHRQESHYKRDELAKHLTFFSLGKQNDLRPFIRTLKTPITWVTGELDAAYCHLANEMASIHTHSTHVILNNASHRAPWEQEILFSQLFI